MFHPLNHRDRPTKAIYLSAERERGMRRGERGEGEAAPVNISRFESSRHVQSMISGSPLPPPPPPPPFRRLTMGNKCAETIQRSAKRLVRGCEKFLLALA